MKQLYTFLMVFFAVGIQAQIINFPDAAFKAKLLQSSPSLNTAVGINMAWMAIDANQNGEIEVSEAQAVARLSIGNAGISNLEGIQYFTNLTELICSNNGLITLDVSALSMLNNLDCSNNQLQELDLQGLPNLHFLYAQHNQLTQFVITQTYILELNISYNQLTSLHIPNSGCCGSFYIDATHNQISSFTMASGAYVEAMRLDNNALTQVAIDFSSDDGSVAYLNLDSNPLVSVVYHAGTSNPSTVTELILPMDQALAVLDISGDIANIRGMVGFEYLDLSRVRYSYVTVDGPNLNAINMKNGFINGGTTTFLGATPNLAYVCADEGEIDIVLTDFAYSGQFPNVQINSYCSFEPGGTFSTVAGTAKYDEETNGCDVSDMAYPYFKLNITNGSINGSVLSNATGHYSIPVQNGSHTITPALENPSYFNVSPASFTANFPADASPLTQDFCLTPNGQHPDLEIVLFALNAAAPGFDAVYKLIYRNKGNQTLSGQVSLTNPNTVAFVSSDVPRDSQTVTSSQWNFSNLRPFESREFQISYNINSPTETPAVNNGDILHFTAAINTGALDETPEDNSFALNQTVVNSFDPNDKVCLQGASVSPYMVGKYVHYRIRFENTGTANAQNIVVKDVIDTAKFDIASLVALDGSHDFNTRINGNTVEFIFEGIQLPFDDASNDGYVVFKIKTKPTLTVGDSFSNSASIYFDYNHPIVTDAAVTNISLLKNQDFEIDPSVVLYPNPANDFLHVSMNNQQIDAVKVFDLQGKLLLSTSNAAPLPLRVDTSALQAGTYLIQVQSANGNSWGKFICR